MHMTPEQWHRVKEVFEATLEHAPGERSAFLGQACGSDEVLRGEVKSLLSSYESESEFLETPAAEVAAPSLAQAESAALIGQQVGHYQVVRELGRGGMGVVYLAQDTTLGRLVALKLLPAYLTGDADRLRRFEREARAASALNHPNILTIHEIGERDGLHFIVTEFIDGVTLRERIKSGELQLGDALDIAGQIASALAAAHEAGIVHRDITPENVMLRRDGYVKVLDFGLAKLTEQQPASVAAAAPAAAGTNTETGVAGTLGYMSPEQARGESVDQRTDIFSLGAVLYEMVTGRAPFAVEAAGEAASAIAGREPAPLAEYAPEAPTGLGPVVARALRYDRDERYRTIAELLADLRSVRSEPVVKRWRTALPIAFLLAVLALTIGGGLWRYSSLPAVTPALPPLKVVPFTSFPGNEGQAAFSPDGNQIAFQWADEKGNNADIYVKSISSGTMLQLITGPRWDKSPSWSPDGQKIAFLGFEGSADEHYSIFIVSAQGGPERKLFSLSRWANWSYLSPTLDWSPDGKYIACSDKASKEEPARIVRISPETGESRTLTSPPAQSSGDIGPAFSPDSQTIAFVRVNGLVADLYSMSINGGEARRLTFDNAEFDKPAWTRDGREIVFSSNRTTLSWGLYNLWRIPAEGGSPERIPVGGENAVGPSISRTGHRLAYVTGSLSGDSNIQQIEVTGAKSQSNPPLQLIASTQTDCSPQFSPDGNRIAFQSGRSGSEEIWVCDKNGSSLVQLTSLGAAGTPRWSPDGKEIAFDSHAKGNTDIYVVSAEGGALRQLTSEASEDNGPSWSRDGHWIYFGSNRSAGWQVWRVPATGGEAVQVTQHGGYIAFESPDGQFVYYLKYLAPGIWRVPVGGGDERLVLEALSASNWGNWAVVSDGIYFVAQDPKGGASIKFFSLAGRRTTEIARLGKVPIYSHGLTVSPDRHTFLFTSYYTEGKGSDIMLVENFR